MQPPFYSYCFNKTSISLTKETVLLPLCFVIQVACQPAFQYSFSLAAANVNMFPMRMTIVQELVCHSRYNLYAGYNSNLITLC